MQKTKEQIEAEIQALQLELERLKTEEAEKVLVEFDASKYVGKCVKQLDGYYCFTVTKILEFSKIITNKHHSVVNFKIGIFTVFTADIRYDFIEIMETYTFKQLLHLESQFTDEASELYDKLIKVKELLKASL